MSKPFRDIILPISVGGIDVIILALSSRHSPNGRGRSHFVVAQGAGSGRGSESLDSSGPQVAPA
jgi:hypothetical protein